MNGTAVLSGGFKQLVSIWFGIVLWKRILGALLLGAVFGLLFPETAAQIKWLGDLFVRLIRMLVVPIVFVTLVSGIAGMGEPSRIGSIGGRAFVLYLGTTLLAIIIGLVFAVLLNPGSGVDISGAAPLQLGEPQSLGQSLMGIVPANPFQSFVNGDILSVIFIAILTGAGIILAGERGKPMESGFHSAAEVMLRITSMVMEVAPFGVFALVAWVMGTEGPATFISVFLLALCVYLACGVHIIAIQGSAVRLLAGLPVAPFFRGIREAQLVAFSTSSSAATLPATLSAAQHNLGIDQPVASSVLPLGATVNMDGTALYVAIVTIFSAQIFGISLNMSDYLMIVIVTVLISVGTASVPSASLFLLAAVLDVIGMTPPQIALVVGFILPFDRLLDMMRTVVNVSGDLAVATIVGRWEGGIDEAVYRAKAVE